MGGSKTPLAAFCAEAAIAAHRISSDECYVRRLAETKCPRDETGPAVRRAENSIPLRASIYGLLDTVLDLSEKVAEMPLCPEQIELVYHVRDAARELSRILNVPADAPALEIRPPDRTPPEVPAPAPVEIGDSGAARPHPAAGGRTLFGGRHQTVSGRYPAPNGDLYRTAPRPWRPSAGNAYDLVFLESCKSGVTAAETAKLMRAWEAQHGFPILPC